MIGSKNNIRVLHAIHSLTGGGAERQLSIIAKNSKNYGVDSAVFCVSDETDDDSFDEVKIFSAKSKARINPRIFSELRKAIHTFRPNVVHVWLPSSMTIPAMMISRLAGARVVFSYRNKMYFTRPITFVEYVVAWLCASKVISNNTVQQSTWWYRLLYRKKRGSVIFNAVNVPELERQDRINDVIRFVSFGRLTKQKNYPVVLEAFSRIRHLDNWRYDIYGKGEDKGALLQQLTTLGLSDRVAIHDYSKQIHSIIVNSDCLLFPSLWEGMPNVLIEAAALGLPAIVSNVPANQNALAGLDMHFSWFDPNDSRQLTAAITAFIREPAEKISGDIRGEIMARFSVDSLMKKYSQEYRELV
ncbi:MAG: glycosyltransferase involved in cell wall biosynthesis [Candidatus Azotimanducaceae bacterium]|jgi:glycosyltransferase involved in cell wall biosynthesis